MTQSRENQFVVYEVKIDIWTLNNNKNVINTNKPTHIRT
jgi:hypothetical protein